MQRGTLFVAPMDVNRLALTGPALPVLEDVAFYASTGTAGFTFSQSGMFVYVAASPDDPMRPIALLDEQGKLEPLPVAKERFSTRPRISPDGSRVALVIRDGASSHIWIYEVRSGRFARFPFAGGNSSFPVWTPDGNRLAFFSDAPTPGPGIYWMRADGAGEAHRLIDGENLVPTCFASAEQLIYELRKADGGLWSADGGLERRCAREAGGSREICRIRHGGSGGGFTRRTMAGVRAAGGTGRRGHGATGLRHWWSVADIVGGRFAGLVADGPQLALFERGHDRIMVCRDTRSPADHFRRQRPTRGATSWWKAST